MTLRPYIRGAAALLVVASAASALALGDRAAATNTSTATAAAAKRLHVRVVEGLTDPLALEPEVFPLRGVTAEYGDPDAGFGASRSELRHGQGTLGRPRDPFPLLRKLDAG